MKLGLRVEGLKQKNPAPISQGRIFYSKLFIILSNYYVC